MTLKKIISASRRTDIPAFYSDWFRYKLEKGFVEVENPFTHQTEVVSLLPRDVLGFVFWSRYPKPLFKHLGYLEQNFGWNHYLLLTLNDYPKILESNTPNTELVISSVEFLANRYGSSYVIWRFDPIVISNVTPVHWILHKFEELCSKLENKVNICITSFVDIYSKVKKNFDLLKEKQGFNFFQISFAKQKEIIQQMYELAQKYGILLKLCCEKNLAESLSIPSASCVNPNNFALNVDDKSLKMRVLPSRKDCTCIESKDIGFYNSCLFGCKYCYAVNSRKSSLNKYYLSRGNKL